MARQDIKKALAKSIGAEGDAIRDRFTRAEGFFAVKETRKEKKEGEEGPQPAVKQIRDSFTFPPEDYELIQALVNRCLKKGLHVTKSETLRAALRKLTALSDEELLEIYRSLSKVKIGRPKK